MTKKYTAADFANARFAEHPNGWVIARTDPEGVYQWKDGAGGFRDEDLPLRGWVPVTTKPTITNSETSKENERYGHNYWLGFRRGFERAGGEIIPNPEPTNKERLEALQRSWVAEHPESGGKSLVEYFNDHGVTAPKED